MKEENEQQDDYNNVSFPNYGSTTIVTSENDSVEVVGYYSEHQPTTTITNNDTTSKSPRSLQRVSLIVLTLSVWCSGILMALYILGNYVLPAVFYGEMEKYWNLYGDGPYSLYSDKTTKHIMASLGIGLHFVMGPIVLFLGAIQFISQIRHKYPRVHRITGRVYLLASIGTAVCGLLFIFLKGCIGGIMMNLGFSLYGILVLLSAYQTYRHIAIMRNIQQHQLWAMRLYSLMIASWLYRLEYLSGYLLQLVTFNSIAMSFHTWFDYIMDFFFYLPNLLIVEIIWYYKMRQEEDGKSNHHNNNWVLSFFYLLVAIVVIVLTILKGLEEWIPGMLGQLPARISSATEAEEL